MRALRQNIGRAFRHPDFRLLWFGAFISFTGSRIQGVAQGWLVYEITDDKTKLASVMFAQMAPVSFLGPLAGTLADTFDKRKVLIVAQSLYALGALFLAAATWMGFVTYWHILGVAALFGIVSCIEMPTRQSVVSRVVPAEDLPAAVPLNAMTFNVARVAGPAIGGLLLASFGAQMCYLINGISYIGIIFAVFAIKTDLSAAQRDPQPIMDLVTEGMLYTWRDLRLKTLFIMECIASFFGLFYMSMMPAIAKDMLGLNEAGLGLAMTMIGVGAFSGLLLATSLSDRPLKGIIVRLAMMSLGIGLILLGSVTSPWLAFPLLALVGMSAIMQFNTTNTLFQTLSPEHLRGRVIAMHVWALAGMSPWGILLFGWFSNQTERATIWTIAGAQFHVPPLGLPAALTIGGAMVVLGAIWGWWKRANLANVD